MFYSVCICYIHDSSLQKKLNIQNLTGIHTPKQPHGNMR